VRNDCETVGSVATIDKTYSHNKPSEKEQNGKAPKSRFSLEMVRFYCLPTMEASLKENELRVFM